MTISYPWMSPSKPTCQWTTTCATTLTSAAEHIRPYGAAKRPPHNSQLLTHGAACVSDTVNDRKPAARNSIMRA